MTTKEKILRALESLPEDLDFNDAILEAIDRLMFLYKLEYAIAEADAGNTVSHEEAKKRMQRWLQ